MGKTQQKPWPHGLFVIILIAVTWLSYTNSFDASFQFDDLPSIVHNEEITSLDHYSKVAVWTDILGRPFSYFTFALGYAQSGMDPQTFHRTNLLVHCINGVLVYFIALFLIGKVTKSNNQMTSRLGACFIAGVFMLQPVQTGAVTYIIQRMTELGTLFYLLGTLIYCWQRPRWSSLAFGKRIVFIASLFFCLVMGVLSKQHAASLPIMLFALELFLFDPKAWKKPFGIITLGLSGIGLIVLFMDMIPTDSDLSPLQYFASEQGVLLRYWKLFFLPTDLTAYYRYPNFESLLQLIPLLYLLANAAIIGLALVFRKTFPFIAFGVIWIYIALSIESSFLPIKDLIFEHRMYLPMLGFGFILWGIGIALHNYIPKRLLQLSAVLLLGIYSYSTYKRNKVWQNAFTLWTDTTAKAPNNGHAWAALAGYYDKKQDLANSMKYLHKAMDAEPVFEAAYNLGNSYAQLQQWKKSKQFYEQAIALNPKYAMAWNNLGNIYTRLGKRREALTYYDTAVQLAPDYADAHYNLALTSLKVGDIDVAERHFEIMLELKPNFKGALFNLSRVYIRRRKYNGAIVTLNKLLAIAPNDKRAYDLRKLAYEQKNSSQ